MSEKDRRFNVIGIPRRRVDGRAKGMGQTRFADDLALPRMLPITSCRLCASTVAPSTAIIWSPLRKPDLAAGEPAIGVTIRTRPSTSVTSTPIPV